MSESNCINITTYIHTLCSHYENDDNNRYKMAEYYKGRGCMDEPSQKKTHVLMSIGPLHKTYNEEN